MALSRLEGSRSLFRLVILRRRRHGDGKDVGLDYVGLGIIGNVRPCLDGIVSRLAHIEPPGHRKHVDQALAGLKQVVFAAQQYPTLIISSEGHILGWSRTD